MKQNRIIIYVISFVAVFMTFTSPYVIQGISIEAILGLIVSFIAILLGHRIVIDKAFLPFFIYGMTIPLIVSILIGVQSSNIKSLFQLPFVLYMINISVLLTAIDYKLTLKFYRILVYISITFFIVQEITYYLYSSRVTAYIKSFDFVYGNSNFDSFVENRKYLNRSSSFFLEPAHFIQFIAPYFCVVLGKCVINKKINLEVIFLFFIFVLAKSGCGMLILATLYFSVIFTYDTSKIKRAIIILFSILGVFIIYYFIKDTEYIKDIINRSKELNLSETDYERSGFIRFFRGFYLYDELPLLNKIFGLSNGSISDFINSSSSKYLFFNETYLNVIQTLIIGTGILGTILFFYYLSFFIRCKSIITKYIIFSLIALFFIESFFLTPKMFLYITIATIFKRHNYEF